MQSCKKRVRLSLSRPNQHPLLKARGLKIGLSLFVAIVIRMTADFLFFCNMDCHSSVFIRFANPAFFVGKKWRSQHLCRVLHNQNPNPFLLLSKSTKAVHSGTGLNSIAPTFLAGAKVTSN